ncbi:hypothetical protein WR25_24703 [Diploscapter pachys]|uniref:Uncharacterized protein n=1 Tax=Diploscapter pachys TaxID=2018661 RepID=A0A2A2L908_9BILA|nr:hypothetical protein WR25_24703 [Diploscapter pachys]
MGLVIEGGMPKQQSLKVKQCVCVWRGNVKRSPPLRCIVSTVAQARNVVAVVMTEANSLARSSGILSSAAERRSITEETLCGILQLPSPFPLYTVCLPSGRIFSLTSPTTESRKKNSLSALPH